MMNIEAWLWTLPFYIAALFFIALQIRKQIAIERRMFSARIHSWWGECWRIVAWGGAAGAAASIAFLFLGAKLLPSTLLILWIIALLLSVIRVRFFCFAYAAGVLGLLQGAAFMLQHIANVPQGIATAAGFLREVHMPSVLALVGILHLAEAFLVHRMARRMGTPLFYIGKRGKPVGGYHLQGFWPVPLLMVVPAAGGMGALLPWQPLFGGDAWQGGWAALAFPVLIGFSSMTVSVLPEVKARQSAKRLAGFGLIVTLLAVALEFAANLWFAAAASLLCFGLHELIAQSGIREEGRKSPYFVHDHRGLKVLAVLPASPAAELGIEPGDIVHKVNGQRIRSRADLHASLRVNAAFTKLEVLNRDGESKFMQRALFANEHYQLGLILCPDDEVIYVAETRDRGLFVFLSARRAEKKPPQDAPAPPVSMQ